MWNYQKVYVDQRKIDLSNWEKKVRNFINNLFFQWKKKRFIRWINYKKEINTSFNEFLSNTVFESWWLWLWIYSNHWKENWLINNLISCIYNKNYKMSWWIFTLIFKNNDLLKNSEWWKKLSELLRSQVYTTFRISNDNKEIILNLFWSEYQKTLIFCER